MSTVTKQDEGNVKDLSSGQAYTSGGQGGAFVGANPKAQQQAFTNLRQFLNANQQAGKNIASTVEKNIINQLGTQKSSTEQQITGAQTATQQGQGVLQQGQGLLQSIAPQGNYISSGPTLNMQGYGTDYTTAQRNQNQNILDIAKDAERLKGFTGFRTGETVQQAAAKANFGQQQAQQQAQQLQQNQQQRAQQLQTETGRSGLLKELVGGNKYGSGTTALDQAFLQKQSGGQLDELKRNVQGYSDFAKQYQSKLGNLAEQNRELQRGGQAVSSGIQTGLSGTQEAMRQGLTTLQGDINKARQEQADWAKAQWAKLTPGAGESAQSVQKKFADMMGLKGGERLYNLNTLGLGQVANLEGLAQANSMQDVAIDKDVAYANALKALSGGDTSLVSKASDLSTKGVTSDLAGRIKEAQDKFVKYAQGIEVGGAQENAVAQANLAEYLANPENWGFTQGGGDDSGRVGGVFGTIIAPTTGSYAGLTGGYGQTPTGAGTDWKRTVALDRLRANIAQLANEQGYNTVANVEGGITTPDKVFHMSDAESAAAQLTRGTHGGGSKYASSEVSKLLKTILADKSYQGSYSAANNYGGYGGFLTDAEKEAFNSSGPDISIRDGVVRDATSLPKKDTPIDWNNFRGSAIG